MNKLTILRLLFITGMVILFQPSIYAQQETLPDNGVQFINETKSAIYFNSRSSKTNKWEKEGYVISPGAKPIKIDINKIAIYDGNSVKIVRELKFKTRYIFWWNPSIKFWDIGEIVD